MAGGVSDVPSKLLRPCNASETSSSKQVKTLLITVFEVISLQPPIRSTADTQSVTQVILLCIAGYVLSRAGVTDKATQRKLNVINVSLFTPALLFSKVSPALFWMCGD
jgi:hypothetical protein